MSRAQFIAGLRQGLRGLSPAEIDDIVYDYDSHFTDAVSSGRSETEIAASLGDPARLADELRTETRLQLWETSRNPRTFVRAGAALMSGCKAFNILVLLPVIAVLGFLCRCRWPMCFGVVGGTGLHLVAGLLSGGGGVAGFPP